MRRTARQQLSQVGLAVDPRTPMGELSLSQQQQVEIARALFAGAKLIVMDEPSSALTEYETQRLLELVRQLRSRGLAILYVSHRMAEVFAIADRITAFRDGSYVGTVSAAATTPNAVIGMMVGRDLAMAAAPNDAVIQGPMLEVRGLTRRTRGDSGSRIALNDVNLGVRRGEIVGLAGLVGAGRSEVARAIFGADAFDEGEIFLEGRRVHFRSPADAIHAGVAMVPEDRKGLALFLEEPIRSNISMVKLPLLARAGVVRRRVERVLANEQLQRLRIRAPGIEAPVRSLSGGNQQKTVLARWLVMRPKVLLLDEPTHGVDVGAKAEIYAIIRALAREGVAILLISSELPEVLELSDRIAVMREGRIATVLDRARADEHVVMLHATGTAA
jgi:ABC-type sugar transport system ATPase subunit